MKIIRNIMLGSGLAALMAAGATGSAAAKPGKFAGPHQHGPHRIGPAPLAAGIIGGLALGAVAANAYAFGYGCYVADREVMDRWGNVYVRPVRVCR